MVSNAVSVALFVLSFLPLRLADAAFTGHFDALLDELRSRSEALSDSTDRRVRQQKNAVDNAIMAIDKSGSLASDVKTAGKAAKILAKAFPDEIPSVRGPMGIVAGGVTPLSDLLESVLDGLQDVEVTAELNELQSLIDDLPDCPAKTKAARALSRAEALIEQADSTVDFSARAKLLSAALKKARQGQMAARGRCPAPPCQPAGQWSGVTSQNRPLSFTVEGESIVRIAYTVDVDGAICSAVVEFTVTGLGIPITDCRFEYSDPSCTGLRSFSGTFDPSPTASGRLTHCDDFCEALETVSWTALRE
jgi:hypothetical protein